jgi:hypothetical protein
MRQLRLQLFFLCAWFFLFYNIERLMAPINLASFVYIFLFLAAGAVIMLPPLYKWSLSVPLLFMLPLYFILKYYLGYPIAGSNLPITVTEIVAIVATLVITRLIMQRLEGIHETVAKLTMHNLRQEIPFEAGQGLIYREIRRARYHERPLALLSISPAEESVQFELNRFFKEAQAAIVRRYVNTRVADLLLKELEDYNIITQYNGHFIALLTEAEQEDVQRAIQRLQNAASDRLGLQFKIGHALFPEEAVTLEQLLTNAEQRMAKARLQSEDGLAQPDGVSEPDGVAQSEGRTTVRARDEEEARSGGQQPKQPAEPEPPVLTPPDHIRA